MKPNQPTHRRKESAVSRTLKRIVFRTPVNLNPAVQTANYPKYAQGKGVEWTKAFTRWVNRSSIPIHSGFAWFAYFAVPSAFSGMISEKWGAHAPRVSCSAPSPNTLCGDVQVRRWRKPSGFPSAEAPTGAAGAYALDHADHLPPNNFVYDINTGGPLVAEFNTNVTWCPGLARYFLFRRRARGALAMGGAEDFSAHRPGHWRRRRPEGLSTGPGGRPPGNKVLGNYDCAAH